MDMLTISEVFEYCRKVYIKNCVGTGGCDAEPVFIVLLPFRLKASNFFHIFFNSFNISAQGQ